LIFWVASTAFETNSRKKISWSEYKNFLIIGKMFSVLMEILPFSVDMLSYINFEQFYFYVLLAIIE
jgi:hypothetical protein